MHAHISNRRNFRTRFNFVFSYFRLKVRNLVAYENHARITVYVTLSSLYENLQRTKARERSSTKILRVRKFLRLQYYRKRGSASYIVREVLSVREREREREIQTDRDGSDVTIVALKLAMNSHFPLPKIRNWRWAYTFPCQKFALLVSPFTLPVSPFTERLPLWRWKSQWVHTFHWQNIFRPLCSPSFKWHEPRDEWSKTQDKWSNPTQSYFVLPIEKMNQINTKNYWK